MVWTMTLAAVLLLPLYQFLENKVSIPTTHQLGQLDKEIVLHCDTSFSYVAWKFNGKAIGNGDDIISNGSHHLTLLDAKKHHSVPPEELHIQCWSSNYPEKIKCTWELQPDTNLPTTFLTTYRATLKPVSDEHVATCMDQSYGCVTDDITTVCQRLGLIGPEAPQKCTQPEWNPKSCLISNFQMFEELPYVLNVTALNHLGSITQLHYFFVENIIRPDPPVNLSISPICHESKKLYIQWQPPHSWPYPDIFPLKYKVRYTKAGSTSYRTVGPYEQNSLVLTGIRRGSLVYVQVSAKDITDLGHDSDWSEVVTSRPWQPYDFKCLPLQLSKVTH